jgi:antitoxin (DNA-binding transcriptional repressor) of toxin-antitoxin stability system
MATIHISEAEATRDFTGVMARVREGAEIVIDSDSSAVALIRPVPVRGGRSISECISLAEADQDEVEPVMDAQFAADMDEIIRNRKPADRSAWD